MARRFGPIRGAGVVTEEQDGDQQIQPGALGWAGYAGLLKRGTPGELIVCPSKEKFLKKCGGVIADSLLPNAALDYYKLANGAGGIVLVRVTDTTERVAALTLYSRNATPLPVGRIDAKNGGRWGGAYARATGLVSAGGDITATTLTTGIATWNVDQWKGGYIELAEVPNTRYLILGNTAAGVITVAGDATMFADWTAGGATDLRYYLSLDADGEVSVIIGDGEDDAVNEFSLSVYVDGNFVKKYANLSTNPESAHYWVETINEDTSNDEITVTDLWTGAHTALTRPANVYRTVASVATNVLTLVNHYFSVSSPGGGNPTFALGTVSADHLEQTITVTMSSATAGTAVSDKFGSLGAVTLGAPFVPSSKWAPPFTITAGGTALAATNVLTIVYRPMVPDALVGGLVYPRKTDDRRQSYRIVANTFNTITVQAGLDLATAEHGTVAANDLTLVEYPQALTGGRDGNAGVTDAHYIAQAWDYDDSPFNQVEDRNLGLVKMATPGVTATAVQKAGLAYANAVNHQYRVEIPSGTTDDDAAETHINDTIGRNDAGVVTFPSYGYIVDPDGAGLLKLVSLTGMIHGREARIASDYLGYHKAAAGITATLPQLVKIPTGERKLNEEMLNPAGIQVIKKKRGNFVLWGDRTIALNTNWRWKHQRELASYYELVMRENFDFIIFAINDKDNDALALTTLRTFFKPEWVKRAIRGNTLEDAAIIKVDAENNTDDTRATGDMYADIALRFADTVERFTIRVSKQGVFSSVG